MHNDYELSLQETAVVTVCTGDDFADRLKQAFDRRSWHIHTSAYDAYLSAERRPALSTLRNALACVAFIDFDFDTARASETAQYLAQVLAGHVTLVAVAGALDTETMLAAMRAGCQEFMERDSSLGEMMELLSRLESTEVKAASDRVANGSILSFFGAKGGVGTTTLVVHLATYLVRQNKKRVLLIDHHPELGHVSVYLGLDGSRVQFQEVVRNVGRLDSELLKGYVARHGSGLEIMSSPDVCSGMKPLEPDAIARTLEFLRGEYDYILIDCGSPTAEANQPVIQLSAVIYLVSTPDLGAVRDLSRYVDTLNPVEGSGEKLQVVLNRASSPFAIDVAQIEKAMKLPVAIRISSSYPEMVRAGNLGEPLTHSSSSEIAVQFSKWANTLTGKAPAVPVRTKSKSIFAMFR